jgi:hypothetical protein
MAKVIIGTEEHYLPPFNFAALERAWPFIEQSMQAENVLVGIRAGLAIIASGLVERDDFNLEAFGIAEGKINMLLNREDEIFEAVILYLKRKLLATEISQVRDAIQVILEEAGLVPKEGESEDQGTLNLSMGTSTQSSPSSLPLASREAAGTA